MKLYKLCLLIVVLLALSALVVYIALPGDQVGFIARNVVYLLAAASSIVFGLYTMWNIGVPSRKALSMLLIIIGLSFWIIGENIFFAYALVDVDPFPSIADFFYIIAYIPLAIGFARELRLSKSLVSGAEALFILVLTLLLVGITLYFGLYKVYTPANGWLSNTFLISYSFGDLLIAILVLPIVTFVFRHRRGAISRTWLWMLAAVLFTLAADILYANYSDFYDVQVPVYLYIDLLWIAGYLSFAVGFLQMTVTLVRFRERALGHRKKLVSQAKIE